MDNEVGMLDVPCCNIYDNGEFLGTVILSDGVKFSGLLNEQHETIERLNQQLRIFSDGLKAEIRETKEVFEDYSECVDEKKQLKLENEQLKELIHTMLMQIDAEKIGSKNAVYSARIIFTCEEFLLIKDIWGRR